MAKSKPNSKRQRRSDEERANALAALAANGGNVDRTARQLGIPAKTLENWAKGRVHPEAAKNGEQKRGPMADALEKVAWELVDSLPGKIKAAPLAQAATAMGIAIDKTLLLQNQPTQINIDEFTDMTDDDLDRFIASMQDEAGEGAAGTGAPSQSDTRRRRFASAGPSDGPSL